jgi:hypothetical protein
MAMSNFNFFLSFIYSTERKEDFFTSMRALDIQETGPLYDVFILGN